MDEVCLRILGILWNSAGQNALNRTDKIVTPGLLVRASIQRVLRNLPPLLYTDDEVEALCMPHNQSGRVRVAETT